MVDNSMNFKASYPARPHAFMLGRIIDNKFEDEVGVHLSNREFDFFVSYEG